jgi:sugar phosphate permease
MQDHLSKEEGRFQLDWKAKLWRSRIFGITWITYAAFYLCRKNFSVAMPFLSRELDATKEQLAWAITLYSILYMLGQFLSGYLNDRYGPRVVVSAGILVSVVSNLFMPWYGSLYVMMGFMAVNGLGQSTGWSGTIKNMTPWFRKKERGSIMALWTTNYVIGGVVATALSAFLVSPKAIPFLGWRGVFVFPAILLFAIGIVYALFTRNKPAEVVLVDGSVELPKKSIFKIKKRKRKMPKDIWLNRTVWVASGVYFFVKFTRYAFLFWLPLYLTEALQYDDVDAGYTSVAFEGIGFLGVLVAGFVSDKVLKTRRFPVVAAMLLGLALVLFVQPLLVSRGPGFVILCIGLTGFFIYGPDSLISGATAMDLGKEEHAAQVAGIINGVGSVGQLISPLVVAFVSSQWGWTRLFQLFVVMAFMASLLSMSQWNYGRTKKKAKQLCRTIEVSDISMDTYSK